MTGADIAVILTEWNQFRALNLVRVAETLTTNTLIDLRNIYPLDEVDELDYHSIGRPS
jgi:UDPglucose 6-dehydrogenase